MDIPDDLKAIVDRLGEAMVQALARDPETRALARQVQAWGFDVALVMEATIALQRRDAEALEAEDGDGEPPPPSLGGDPAQWSEEDKAFLRTFRISM